MKKGNDSGGKFSQERPSDLAFVILYCLNWPSVLSIRRCHGEF